MKIQTLISTMNCTNPKALLESMKINGDYYIINQITGTKDQKFNNLYNMHETGLSKSRNAALFLSDADICLIADDDIEYQRDFQKTIREAYKKYPKADIIAFYLDSDDEKSIKKKLKFGRIRKRKSLKIASCQLSFKRHSILQSNVRFDEKFGAGAKYKMGEENIFLMDCIRAGLKAYSYPVKIGTVREKHASTWFNGYNEEYFKSRGAGYYRISKRFYIPMCLLFALKKKNKYNNKLTVRDAIRHMILGVKEFKQNIRIENNTIDFVVPWVDSTSKKWQNEKAKYETKTKGIDARQSRYRDWGIFQYWFRSIEKNAPWVHKIYLVTNGEDPEWLDTNNSKIKIVHHEDFIDKKYLPTFNSNTIELNICNIKELSENFVLFNDDVFLLGKTKPTDFFKNGIPINTCTITDWRNDINNTYYKTNQNNINTIRRNFDYKKFRKENFFKLLSLRQEKYIYWTLKNIASKDFPGFANYHGPNAYKKSIFKEVLYRERCAVEKSVSHKLRNYNNSISDWVVNYWQFAMGTFNQKRAGFTKHVMINDIKTPNLIKKSSKKVLCLSEGDDIDNIEEIKHNTQQAFEYKFPEKSSFELENPNRKNRKAR